MKKTVLSLVTLSVLLTLAGCSDSTQVATTPEVVIPQETTNQVVVNSGKEIYIDTKKDKENNVSTFSDNNIGFSFQYPDNGQIQKDNQSNYKRIQNYISTEDFTGLGSGKFYIEVFYRDINTSCAHEMGSVISKYTINGISVSRGYGEGGGDAGGTRYALCFQKSGKTIYIGYTENGDLYADQIFKSLKIN